MSVSSRETFAAADAPRLAFRRVLLKLSGEALMGEREYGLDRERIDEVAGGGRSYALSTTDQLLKAAEYQPLIVHYSNGAAVRLGDVAQVTDSVEDRRNAGLSNGKLAVLIILFRQPSANIIETVDRVKDMLPVLRTLADTHERVAFIAGQTERIMAFVDDTGRTLASIPGAALLGRGRRPAPKEV